MTGASGISKHEADVGLCADFDPFELTFTSAS